MGSCCGTSKPDSSKEKRMSDNSSTNKKAKAAKQGAVTQKPPEVVEESEGEHKKAPTDGAAVKGGESAYNRLRFVGKDEKKKTLATTNYNTTTGLVSKESKEFGAIREYLGSKNYQLQDSIGSGNFAEVYKAYMTDRNRYVAVKVIDLTQRSDNYRIKNLPREIEILRTLKHPSIIKTYEVSQTKNRIFMIMEFCPNGTITTWLRDKGAFAEPNAWDFLKRIVDGIHYMHTMKMAHRDLKLENILLSEQNTPKISDFSFSLIVDPTELSQEYCGSLPYFAPEILSRKPYHPLVYDIWSLGVCFYIMLCDGLPFKTDNDKLMLTKQLEKDWDFKKRVRDKLSNELKTMIRKMLEPDVTKRATIQDIANDPWFKTPLKPNP